MSAKKILLIGFIFVLLAAIPLTVYLVQQEQKTKSGAQQNTTISLDPATKTINVTDNFANDVFSLDAKVFPGSGATAANQVSFVKFTITYDPTYLATVAAGTSCSNPNFVNDAFCPNTSKFPNVEQGPIYDTGKITISLSTGNDSTKAITDLETAGTVYFKVIAATNETDVQLPKDTAQVLAIGSNEQFNENVLLNTQPAKIAVILGNAASPTDSPTPTLTLTPTPTGTSQATGPTCTSLSASPSNSGTAPFSVNLTAVGQSSNSTISKITFNFGDGQNQDITSSSGIGTNSVSVLQSHTYTNAGNYTATAVLTDASGNVSPIGNCSLAISSNGAATNNTTTTTVDNNTTAVVTATPTQTPAITETPLQNEQTGPKEIITIGSIGAIITVIGAVLLLAL